MTGDEQRSSDVVVASFFDRAGDAATDWTDDAGLLRDVRRRAMEQSRPEVPAREPGGIAAVVRAMPALQREVVELALVAQVAVPEIARALGVPRAVVSDLVAAGLRAIRDGESVGQRGERAQV